MIFAAMVAGKNLAPGAPPEKRSSWVTPIREHAALSTVRGKLG